jgi:hypothetical protein
MPAAAQVFPPDNEWLPVRDHSCQGPLFDAALDTATGAGTGSRDLVGSSEPTVQAWADAMHLYFRLRVDTDPRAATDWDNFGWGCQVSTGTDVAFEWMALLNGASPRVAVYRNDLPEVPETPDDRSEVQVAAEDATPEDSDCAPPWAVANARDCSDGSDDYFVDFAVPRADMLLGGQPTIQIVCGAVSNAEPEGGPNLITGNSGDIVGIESVAGAPWDAISSCPLSLDCGTFPCLDAGLICASSGACVECEEHQHCDDPAAPWCEPASQSCVECLDDVDCAVAGAPICHSSLHTCVAAELFADGFEDGGVARARVK